MTPNNINSLGNMLRINSGICIYPSTSQAELLVFTITENVRKMSLPNIFYIMYRISACKSSQGIYIKYM